MTETTATPIAAEVRRGTRLPASTSMARLTAWLVTGHGQGSAAETGWATTAVSTIAASETPQASSGCVRYQSSGTARARLRISAAAPPSA